MPISCTVYARSLQGVTGGQLSRFLASALGLESSSDRRAVWANKRPGDRNAKLRFADDLHEEQLGVLLRGELRFKEELVKCELNEGGREESLEKKQKKNSSLSIEQLVLPWLPVPYPQQLLDKQRVVKEALDAALSGIRKSAKSRNYSPLPTWGNLQIDETTPCLVPAYRNKCEFSFGLNAEGEPDLGFVLARATASAEPVVAAGESLWHIPHAIACIVGSLRTLLRMHITEFPLFSHISKSGCWRICMVRVCPNSQESQVLVQSGALNEFQESRWEGILLEWANLVGVSSVYVQYNRSVTDTIVLSELHTMKLVVGKPVLSMKLGQEKISGGVTFSVNPLSFFQTNSTGCELLFGKVFDSIPIFAEEQLVLFDVCCGVGAIGQYLSKRWETGGHRCEVVGVDIVEEAVADAAVNAKNNALSCTYVAGRAEQVLSGLIAQRQREEGRVSATTITTTTTTTSTTTSTTFHTKVHPTKTRFVCVVDPPRSGLHKSVISAIRDCERISQVVYVSCNPNSLAEDLVRFCEPLTSSPAEEGVAVSQRFVPLRAGAVDMFPHTPHCEVVVVLNRTAA